jgi:hypothetical protein
MTLRAALPFLLLLSACPTAEEPLGDLIFDLPTEGSSGDWDFGDVTVGSDPVRETLTATNNTDGPLEITLEQDFPGGGFIVTTPDAPFTLEAGAELPFSITFNPSETREYSGSLDYVWDDGVVAWTVTGTGI